MTLATGTKLGPYEVLGVLGAGGMGEVYRAKDARLGHAVATKVLPIFCRAPRFSGGGTGYAYIYVQDVAQVYHAWREVRLPCFALVGED